MFYIAVLLLTVFSIWWDKILINHFVGRQALPPIYPKCRSCEKDLPDPILRDLIGHGAYLCPNCHDEISLEVGLRYPDWWDSTPAPTRAIPPPSICVCPSCDKEHAVGYFCPASLQDLTTVLVRFDKE